MIHWLNGEKPDMSLKQFLELHESEVDDLRALKAHYEIMEELWVFYDPYAAEINDEQKILHSFTEADAREDCEMAAREI